MKLLITGGSGMLGSYLKSLFSNAYTPSSKELDLTDSRSVREYMFDNRFNYVIHLAAHVGSLHDNIANRINYFDTNILMNTIITKYSYESGVKSFLGILSTCIYPDTVDSYPIKEEWLHNGKPHDDLMSYAYAKRSHAVQIKAYKETHNVNYNYLIPCNLYGRVSTKHKDRSHYINDLIFKIIKSQNIKKDSIDLFGDGTPFRQFMLADDFAKIIALFVKKDMNSSFNVAPDENLTIDQIAKVALNICNASNFKINYDASFPNGQLRKDVDTSFFKSQFKDFSFTPLSEGIEQIYNYYKKKI